MYTWIFVLLSYIKTAIKNIQNKTSIPKKLVSRGGQVDWTNVFKKLDIG